ncbi:hypothetical protein A1O1_07464 [Capronia coronata CBS 617.96]|uniref:25S rRNA adenine-N(1) methyltransferase n=1 Tax=Capronia coronata CBS 617.96 TaxID=1182541 RepID=W9XTJ1_9EURO|nr:uncharacterized protein A1O1_07464 [Capronia coronata CBS 617.96]EXJ83837.1 hypothetical protein A1O1_07464 [Capronia coronata CBS 617.96]
MSSGSSKPRSKAKAKALKAGRPPFLSTTTSKPATAFNPERRSLSAKRTRSLIRTHHVLQKRLAQARAEKDAEQVRELEAQLAASGGLETYQLASTVGQSAERGGDSSRVLVDWLREELEARKPKRFRGHSFAFSASSSSSSNPSPANDEHGSSSTSVQVGGRGPPSPRPLRILEVGALSTTNALNIPLVTSVRRIDLRSSGPGIEEADFMTLPLPDSPDGKGEWHGERGYDVISLSLVLNYVPDAPGRGEMLRRTTMFFSRHHENRDDLEDGDADRDEDMQTEYETPEQTEDDGTRATITTIKHPRVRAHDGRNGPRPPGLLPCLFLVLPAPTLHNSRYLTPDHLTAILSSLGYINLQAKTTRKLHYSLWRYDPRRRKEWVGQGGKTVFHKKEINPGSGRNNFCIVLDDREKE